MNTTKTAQFTPGPWVGYTNTDEGRHIISEAYAQDVIVCEQVHTDADISIIAAAPAMYAELVNGLGLLEASYHDMCDKYGKDSMQAEIVWDQVERTRNVIAQAEGRER